MQLRWKKSALITGSFFLILGSALLLHEAEKPNYVINQNLTLPDGLYLGLSHIEHDLNKLERELTNKRVIPRGQNVPKATKTPPVFNAKASMALLSQIKNSVTTIDKDLVTWGQTQETSNRPAVEKKFTNIWAAVMALLTGVFLFAVAAKDLFRTQLVKASVTEASDGPFVVTEKAIFNRLPEAIFYLTSHFEILWANQAANSLKMTREDLSHMVKSAYKEEDGQKLSSFNHQDYILDVEFLEAQKDDGEKIFCLIMTEAKEDSKGRMATGHERKQVFQNEV